MTRTSELGLAWTVLRLLTLSLLAPLASEASPVAARSTIMACGELPHVVKLRLVFDLPLPLEVDRTIRLEVERLWEPQGIQIEWADADEARRTRVIYTVVRRGRAPGMPKKRVAGWIRFGESGEPANLIEASHETILCKIQKVKHLGGWRFDESTEELQASLLGRAIGRVVAHELGHWLLGPGHGPEGLMKRNFSGEDLIHPRGPSAHVLPCRIATLARREKLD